MYACVVVRVVRGARVTLTRSLVLSCIGAAYGTAQAGLGLCRAGTRDPNMIIKGIIPVAMAGVRGIYGLVLSIIIMSGIHPDKAGGEGARRRLPRPPIHPSTHSLTRVRSFALH